MESSKHFRKRDAILSYMRQTTAHPSAETVFAELKKQMPDISLATVYRNLALFRQQGLIISLGAVQGVERFDGNVKPHVHFICSCCGRVEDLHKMQIPEELCLTAAMHTGANIHECRMNFSGVCSNCSASQSS